MSYFSAVSIRDGANLDAFNRLRTSEPVTLFDSAFLYDKQPLLWEEITSGGGAVNHSATEGWVSISSSIGLAAMQTYEWIRYQPGKSQLVEITFRLTTAAAGNTQRIGLFNSTNNAATVTVGNGIYLERSGTTVNFCIASTTTAGSQTVAQASWNIDTFGAGALNPSGKTLDLTKTNILLIDFQWLGVGRVRIGWVIDGIIYYAHEFDNAGSLQYPYMRTGTLPLRAESSSAGVTSGTIWLICAAVMSEGGSNTLAGYEFPQEFTGTAGNGTRVHLGSMRPFLTFNSITNRSRIEVVGVETVVTGANPVYFEVVYGATFSAGPTWAGAAYSAYSAAEVTTAAGTISTTPIVGAAFYNAASAANKSGASQNIKLPYPLTLTAGSPTPANRALGTVSIYATGIGGTSACRSTIIWKEIR